MSFSRKEASGKRGGASTACRKPRPSRPLREGKASRGGGGIRIARFLAQAGLGSRRRCERIVEEGRVAVDGEEILTPAARVDPFQSRVEVDGKRVAPQERIVYLLNKPRGLLCTARDPQGRPTVYGLLKNVPHRLFSIGRLDRDSEGLLLLTNDGTLGQVLCRPERGVPRVYRVLVEGTLGEKRRRVLSPLDMGDFVSRGMRVLREESAGRGKSWLTLALREGKKREVRRVLASEGLRVKRLLRIAFGPIRLGKLEPGCYRRLSGGEVERLLSCVQNESY